MTAPPEVACVNASKRIAVLEDGEALPITEFFGCGGDECEPDDAVSCVAGPTKAGTWLCIDLDAMEEVPVQ